MRKYGTVVFYEKLKDNKINGEIFHVHG